MQDILLQVKKIDKKPLVRQFLGTKGGEGGQKKWGGGLKIFVKFNKREGQNKPGGCRNFKISVSASNE